MCIASIRMLFERRGKTSIKLGDTYPLNPRTFVLLLMEMTTIMVMMIRSLQVVHGILLSHKHIRYNAFLMEK
jgi:hypothetical protein